MSFYVGEGPSGNALGNGRQTVAHGVDSQQATAALNLAAALEVGGTAPGVRPTVANATNLAAWKASSAAASDGGDASRDSPPLRPVPVGSRVAAVTAGIIDPQFSPMYHTPERPDNRPAGLASAHSARAPPTGGAIGSSSAGDVAKEAEQKLFHVYNANGTVPTWMLEQCKKTRINGIKWGSSIPANANSASVAKYKISFMIRLKIVELISSVKVGVKVKCAEVNRHDATVNSIPQEEEMQLCLWDVIDVPKINIKKELKVRFACFQRALYTRLLTCNLLPHQDRLVSGLRGNADLWAILPANMFPEIANDDSKLYTWICHKVTL